MYVSCINVILAIVYVADTSLKAKIRRRAREMLPKELVLLEEVFLFSVVIIPRCGVNLESQVHALFTCCHAEAIWVGLGWWHIITTALHSNFGKVESFSFY
ncbi:hypothetical protein Ddye_023517 [Dipteronia dyeriana]|uniref:Uncharacterized protein n=1 Tax=Dipteronia dyeriana TaxID=168575 RepID=A0AAD9TT54_9ROSI|nr:hypothetical protein Ddye_023517 [Dipteronia dyeriana]